MDHLDLARGICGRKGFILRGDDFLIYESQPNHNNSTGLKETHLVAEKPSRYKLRNNFILKKQQLDAVSLMKGAYQEFD